MKLQIKQQECQAGFTPVLYDVLKMTEPFLCLKFILVLFIDWNKAINSLTGTNSQTEERNTCGLSVSPLPPLPSTMATLLHKHI